MAPNVLKCIQHRNGFFRIGSIGLEDETTNHKGGVMKKGLIVALILAAAVAFSVTMAQACLVEDEPGRGGDHRWRSSGGDWGHAKRWHAPEPAPPVFGRWHASASSPREDGDDWKAPSRFWSPARFEKAFWQMPDHSFFGWLPVAGQWGDIFKKFPRLEDCFDTEPAFVLFGGFIRHMFVGVVFPYHADGAVDPPKPPTPTPVPAAVLLLGTGLAGLGLVRMRLNRARG
jgi:hypothetical protein